MKHLLSILLISILIGSPADAQQHSGSERYILVLNKTSDTAWQLDAATGKKIAEYPTEAGPHEVAISPDRTRAALTNYGNQNPGHTVSIINLKERKLEKVIDLKPYTRPHGIQWFSDGRRLVVSAEGRQSVVIVDTEQDSVIQAIGTNQEVSHMVELGPGERRVYVTNIGSGSLSVLDLAGGSVVKTISTGEGSEGITLANKDTEIWTSNREDNTLTVVDLQNLVVTDTLRSRIFPIRAETSPNGRWIAVSNARSDEVTIFDAASREHIGTVSTKPGSGESGVPIGLTFSDDSRRLYVANSEAREVVVIDTGHWSVVNRFGTGETPDGIAYFTR